MCYRCLKHLGVKSKLKIYEFLKEKGPTTVNVVVEELKLTQPTISHHLTQMADAGLLISTKKGREVFYEINNKCPYADKKCDLVEIEFNADR